MQFDSIRQQQFERATTGGRFDTAVVVAPTAERIESAARKIGITCKVTAKADGSIDLHTYDLALIAKLETEQHGVLTVTDAVKKIAVPGSSKLRCQAVFRDSNSFAAFLALGADGRPFVFDSGTGTKHWLRDADWRLMRGAAPSGDGEIMPLFSIDAFRADRFVRSEPPPRRWLFIDVLPLGKVGIVVAPGGTGKSWFLIQAGVSVATGCPLAGIWKVGEPGGVLLLLAEDDEEEIHRRVNTAIQQLVISGQHELIAALRENLIVRSMVGENNQMTAVLQSRDVELTIYVDRLIATAKQIPNLKLIVIDPASRFRGGDENSAQDTTRFVEAIERVAQATGANILIAHHTNKGSMQNSEQSQTASRGSSALTDGVRWQLNLATMTEKGAKGYAIHADERHQYLTATITKTNYAPPRPEIILKRGDGGYLHHVTLTSQKDQVAQDVKTKIVNLVAEKAKAGQHFCKTKFENDFGGIDGPLGIGKNAVRSALTELVAANHLSLDANKKLAPAHKAKLPTVPAKKPDTPIP